MAESQLDPERTSKQHDTWEPVMCRCFDANGPFDLTGATVRFLGKANIDSVPSIIDSDTVDHGEAFVVEDDGGEGLNPGDPESLEWPVGSSEIVETTTNRGWVRYEQSETAVSIADIFEIEIEATKAGKKLTFPNKEEKNPRWEISPDIA